MNGAQFYHSDSQAGGWDGVSRDNEEPAPEQRSEPETPSGFTQQVLDQLNRAVAQERTGKTRDARELVLEQIGSQIRQWRLERGYTRTALANTLQIDKDRLVSVENGIAPADATATELLLKLRTILTGSQTDVLNAAIEEYLSMS